MRCDKCEYDNPQAALYCYSCAHSLSDTRESILQLDGSPPSMTDK